MYQTPDLVIMVTTGSDENYNQIYTLHTFTVHIRKDECVIKVCLLLYFFAENEIEDDIASDKIIWICRYFKYCHNIN